MCERLIAAPDVHILDGTGGSRLASETLDALPGGRPTVVR
jgi:hypothetical protein